MPSQSSPKFYLSILIGLLAIGLGFYGAFFLQIKNNIQWIFIALLLIAGIACLSVLWIGRMQSKDKVINATNAFAVFVFLCTLIFSLISPPTEESSLKIQVKDWQGSSILANEKQVIKVSSGKFSKIYDLNSDSEVLLTFMKDADSVEIEVLNYDWQINKKGKSAIYPIPSNEILSLVLVPAKERCCLYGRIAFDDNKPHDLANIIVQAEGVSTKTQADGSYRLELPMEKQLQTVSVYAKSGSYSGNICCCNTVSPCSIPLSKN